MKSIRFFCMAVFIIALPTGLLANDDACLSRPTSQAEPVGDLFPPNLAVLRSPDVLKIDIGQKIQPQRLSLRPAPGLNPSLSLFESSEDGSRRTGKVWPITLSVLVPGAGEIYLGYYKRGIALVAAEVLAWTGYFHYHDKGLDERKDYENFADENWDFDRWIDWHPDAYPLDLTFAELELWGKGKPIGPDAPWPAYHTYFPKETEKQNYYETIGKYDWFISGWADFDPIAQPHDTDLRTLYRGMRKTSNDHLKTADRFIYLSLAARAFSIVEIILLTRDPGQDSVPGAAGAGSGFDLTIRPVGFTKTELALEYRF